MPLEQARKVAAKAHVGVEHVEIRVRLELDEEVDVAADGVEILPDDGAEDIEPPDSIACDRVPRSGAGVGR